MQELNDKVALITGASSGIGEATAKLLASHKVKVAMVARRKHNLENIANDIRSNGGTALVIEGDVTDKDQCERAVKTTIDEWGTIDILINNAGVMLIGPASELPIEDWEQMIKLNELGLLYMTRMALPSLSESHGHIVNVSSVAGRTTRPGSAVYNMTKWGVNGFTDALRQEMVEAKNGVRTTLIEPGYVATELQSHNTPETQKAMKERFGGMKPLQAEDIAAGILYAVSQPPHVSVNEVLIRPTGQQI